MTARPTPDPALVEAYGLIQSGRTAEAVKTLEAYLRVGTSSSVAFVLLGQALHQEGRLVDAQHRLEDGAKAFPLDSELQGALAQARWMNGAGDKFLDPFLAAVAAHPQERALRMRCADLLRLSGKIQTAEKLLREGLKLAPHDTVMMAQLGVILDELGNSAEAVDFCRAAVRTHPQQSAFRLNLAHALMRLNRPQEALKEISWVRSVHPAHQRAICYEATALKQVGDPRYRWLCDYDALVKVYDLKPPAGFSNMAAFNAALGKRLRELQRMAAHPLEQSLRGGSQANLSQKLQADDPLIRAYVAALDESIRAYIAAMPNDVTHPLTLRRTRKHAVSGMWSVLLKPGGFHVNHIHPDGWISSSYYVSLPKGMSGGKQQGWIKFGEPNLPIPGCGVEKVVEPKEGRLVLFPSYMWHGTIPFSSGERLTAPFDVIPA